MTHPLLILTTPAGHAISLPHFGTDPDGDSYRLTGLTALNHCTGEWLWITPQGDELLSFTGLAVTPADLGLRLLTEAEYTGQPANNPDHTQGA